MALNKLNYNFQPIDFRSGLGDLVQNFREGQKMREEREKYGQEREGRGYGNMIKAAEAMYAPEQYKANAEMTRNQADFFAEQIKFYPQKAQAEIYSLIQQGKEREAQAAIHAIDKAIKQFGYNYVAELLDEGQPAAGYAQPPTEEGAYAVNAGNMGNAGIETTNQNFTPDYGSGLDENQSYMFDLNGEGAARNPGLPIEPSAPVAQAKKGLSREQKLEKALNSPVGRSILKQVGIEPLEEDIKKKVAFDALDVKYQEKTQEAIQSEQSVLDNLYELRDIVKDYPTEFNKVNGPISSIIKQYKGTDAEKELLGKIKTLSGNVTLAVAGSLPGAFRAGEQTLLDQVKPVASDTPQVFKGKLTALIKGMELAQRRNELISDYISAGMRSSEAIKKAREETSFDALKTMVVSYNNAKNNTSDTSNFSLSDIDAEIARREKGGL